ncbi:P-loop NTPase fold protein [Streptomyces sp. NPDC127036]|uniref:P-loop NTPase fold protein n=1 Tax=Streptomyces sp. NPDC127036 TaxID=3347112 RepID=UPI00365D6154
MAQQLARTVRDTTGSLAVGLIGPFGSGKSSVVRLLTTELAVNSEWAVLHVSAEHHSGVARARALMYALLEAAHQKKLIDKDTYLGERARLEGSRQRTLPRSSGRADAPGNAAWSRYLCAAGAGLGWVLAMLMLLWLLGVSAVAVVHLLDAGHGVSAWTWFAPKGASSLTGVLVSAAAIAAVLAAGREGALQSLKAYEITVSSPRPESTDELEQAFAQLLKHIKRRLVIAVDDIDRLAASDVLDALATVRSFLLTGTQHRHQPVFVLSCDEDIVREAIVGVRPGLARRPTDPDAADADSQTAGDEPSQARRESNDAVRKATEDAAQEYLNKLFTLRLVLPAHYDADLREYAQELLMGATANHPVVAELGGPTQSRMLLEVLVHRGVREPRHVIRLLNSFFSDYQLARRREQPVGSRPPRIAPGEVTGHPIELARLTVLRHDFRDLYDAIQSEHQLLHLLDEALLDTQEAHADPLLARYRASGSSGRLDLDKHPGLAFLSATAARARTERPAHIGPLITLGSSRASRLLGSQLATEIENDLVQRNGDALAARLTEAGQRTRILEAATASLEAARQGQDLDNAVTAVLQALGTVSGLLMASPSEEEQHAVHALTDCIIRQHGRLTLPVPSHLLAPLLYLSVAAHLPRIRQALRPVPEQPGEARAWAVTLLALPPGDNATFLAPSLDNYFDTLAGDGGTHDLAVWESQSRQPGASSSWPPAALAALLAMAARHDGAETVRHVGTVITGRDDDRGWDHRVLLALLESLSSTAAVRREAVAVLCLAPAPSTAWGDGFEDSDATLLATQIIQAVAQALEDDDDQASVLTMLELLTRWLPAAQQLPDKPAAEQAIADAAAIASSVHADLTVAAGMILEQLHEEPAASCAIAMATHLASHRDLNDPIGTGLRDVLVSYLRRSGNSDAEAPLRAVAACTTALTGEVESATPAGRFARSTLPMLLTTTPGAAMAAVLIQRLTGSLNFNNPGHAQDVLPSLRVLLQDPATRQEHLYPVIQQVQQFMTYGAPTIALDFAVHYITASAVDVNWLNWLGSHWVSLSQHTRDLGMASAERPELEGIPALRDSLVQHLLDTQDIEPWQYAAPLWSHSTTDQQSSLLAHARARCPALAHHANQADAGLLSAGLVKAGEHISDVLALIRQAPEFEASIMLYLNNRLQHSNWMPDLAATAIAESNDPAALWKHVLPFMTEDQTSATRTTEFIAALIEHHKESVPDDIVTTLTPVLLDADPQLARALGWALRAMPKTARKLRRAMDGFSNSQAQRARNAAFKEASGI